MICTYSEIAPKLAKSAFRSRFRLSVQEREYALLKGRKVIESHCRDFVKQRLAPENIPNDGKQTPMRGHPVFVAQHACACCCRGCLEKWYRVPKDRELTPEEQEGVVKILMDWITGEVKGAKS